MTRSIFDPTGPETEHSGSRNLGPSADNNSHMPDSVTDGVVSEDEVTEHEALRGDEAQREDLGIDSSNEKGIAPANPTGKVL